MIILKSWLVGAKRTRYKMKADWEVLTIDQGTSGGSIFSNFPLHSTNCVVPLGHVAKHMHVWQNFIRCVEVTSVHKVMS